MEMETWHSFPGHLTVICRIGKNRKASLPKYSIDGKTHRISRKDAADLMRMMRKALADPSLAMLGGLA